LRLAYPLLWSRLGREASSEQSIATAAALARRGVEVTLLMPRGRRDPPLTAADLKAYYEVEGDFGLVQRSARWASEHVLPSVLWLRQASRDPATRAGDLLYSRIPAAMAFGRFAQVPFATEHYRPWPDDLPWMRPVVRGTARFPHSLGFILHSDHAAQSYRRAGVPAQQVLVAHNGSDPRHMKPRLDKDDARAILGLPSGRAIALYAGRMNGEKGLDQLLAAARLRPEILFLLVGSEGDGRVERASAALDNVRIVPWQAPAALSAWLQAADILVIPPASAPLERFRRCVLPMKLYSYLAAERPIMAPQAPDTAELLRHGENAFLVPPDQPEAAAAALDRLLGDPAWARTLAANARRLAEGLTWDDRAAKIAAFLEERLEAVRSAVVARRRTTVSAPNKEARSVP
jgi:glycosyltransferase involved in cell wall biosynthesis